MDGEDDMRKENKNIETAYNVSESAFQEIKASAGGIGNDTDLCVICLETVSERAVAFPCRHYNFDFLCLASWLQARPTCPLCNTQVRLAEYGWKSPEDLKVYKVIPSTRETSSTATSPRPSRLNNGYDQRSNPSWRRRRTQSRHPITPEAALLRRKEIYSLRLYSSHVGTNRLSRFRDLTPQLFVQDQQIVSRARHWIRRELQVFQFLNSDTVGEARRANNAEFLLEYIIAILKTVDVKGNQAEDMLQEFLGRENTRLFLHELKAWLRSPYMTLEDWDRHVQYNTTYNTVPEPWEHDMGSLPPKAPACGSRRSDRNIRHRRHSARHSKYYTSHPS